MTADSLKKTPLHAEILALKARMTGFGGWEMPVQYDSITREHAAVRSAVGMFDISHMGKFELEGKGLLAQLNGLVPSDLSGLQVGQAKYTVLLNDRGGILDDLIVYYRGEGPDGLQKAVAIVNAATAERDRDWMQAALDRFGTQLVDRTGDRVLLAVQGPDAERQLQAFTAESLGDLKSYRFLEGTIFGQPAFLARTGYTGEDGFEVMLDPETGKKLWKALLAAGAVPCGLGARDTLRLEAAMALYGQDIDDTVTPLEAGLGWLVHLDAKGDFVGRAVLERQKRDGVDRKLVGLELQGRAIARHDYPVLHEGHPVGRVTSGTLAPTLSKPIALAYVPPALAKPGQNLAVSVRDKPCPAIVVKRPFYKRDRAS